MESSCLLNKGVHKFEDCLKRLLFQLYHKEWRKVYKFPVPALDPVILHLSGYCPFQVSSACVLADSVVLVNHKLSPLAAPVLERFKPKWIVIHFDEYLIQLTHREKLSKLDPKMV